nr:hypothetical protein [Pseudobdellovibrionaceae bacterium]
MKKTMMLIAACLMSFAPASFAQTEAMDLEQTFDLEEGPMSNEELLSKIDIGAMQIGRSNKGEVVAGAIIGLIAGAIAAEALDSKIDARYRDNDRHNGGWNRPHRPNRPGFPPRPSPRPQPRPQVACYAQSPRGQVFRVLGFNARIAQ